MNFSKENLLMNRDSFDKEVYNLIKHDIKIMKIRLPDFSLSERHRLHTFSRTNVNIYSKDRSAEISDVYIVFNRRYITQITKKYNDIVILLINLSEQFTAIIEL